MPDAFNKLPTAFTSYTGTPGSGGTVTAFTIAYQSPPTPMGQNQYWQELNKRLGVTWQPIITPQPTYGQKSAALIAGGSLPDLFYLNPGQNAAPQYQAMGQGAFLDLTPYVTGDAGKKYKNLANIPAATWNNVKFKGKVYGVPKPIQSNGNIPFYRADWAAKVGKETFASPTDVHDLLVAFTKNDPDGDGQADTWGMSRYGLNWTGWDNTIAFNMYGTPFNWRQNSDGTLSYTIETDEFKQGLSFLTQVYKDGGYYPDSGSLTFAQAQNNFIGGKTGLHSEGFGNFVDPRLSGSVYNKITTVNPKAVLKGIMPSDPGGSKANTYNTPGSFGFTGIPASVTDPNKIDMLLRILDYLASPFGSAEWLFLSYGVPGVDSKPDANGVPALTPQGQSEKGDLIYLMGALPVFFYPQSPGAAEYAQNLSAQIIKIGLNDPSWPLYSATNVAKASELNQFGYDTVSAIITGQQPLSSLDDAISQWKSRGGEMIRQEYEASLKASS